MESFYVSRSTVRWLVAAGGASAATTSVVVIGAGLTELVLMVALAFFIGSALTALQYWISYIVSTRWQR